MLIELVDARATDPAVVGSKAARLAVAIRAGYPVPGGFVVPVGTEPADSSLIGAAAQLGERVAVRSSGVAEDLAGASFAGLYESFLNVPAAKVPEAVRRCRASAGSERARSYGGTGAASGMAVLVQAMLDADAAGVAFTADPLTGDRDTITVTAVSGLGEQLVAGEVEGERWRLVPGLPPQAVDASEVLVADQAAAVGAVARELEGLFGGPQDVEWASAAGTVWVVQTRPMTALPSPAQCAPPGPGLWACNFRLGEWLPDPVTPLFADWLLPVFDTGFRQAMRETAGAAVSFPYGLVYGWYYATPNPRLAEIPFAIVRSRGRMSRTDSTSRPCGSGTSQSR